MDFAITDINSKEGFPANIDTSKPVVVQVMEPNYQSCVLYYSAMTERLSRCYLPLEIGEKFKTGIYIFV